MRRPVLVGWRNKFFIEISTKHTHVHTHTEISKKIMQESINGNMRFLQPKVLKVHVKLKKKGLN